MKQSIALSVGVINDVVIEAVEHAASAGFDRIWTTERAGRDAFAAANAVAHRTPDIAVGTGIAYAFTRHPVAVAGMLAQLQCASPFAVASGLGTGTRGMRQAWYGADFDHPAPRLAEYALIIRAFLRLKEGEAFEFEGRFHSIRFPAFELAGAYEVLAEMGPVPLVFGSGLNALMLKAMGASCEGVLVHPLALARSYMTDVALPAIALGTAQQAEPVRVSAFCMTALADDHAVAHEAAQRQLAFYFSTPSYATVAAGTAWEQSAHQVREAFSGGERDWSVLARLVTDDMVADLCVVGTRLEVQEQLRTRQKWLLDVGIDEIVLVPVSIGTSTAEVADQVHALAQLKEAS